MKKKKEPLYQLYYKGQYFNTIQLNEFLAKEESEKKDKEKK